MSHKLLANFHVLIFSYEVVFLPTERSNKLTIKRYSADASMEYRPKHWYFDGSPYAVEYTTPRNKIMQVELGLKILLACYTKSCTHTRATVYDLELHQSERPMHTCFFIIQ